MKILVSKCLLGENCRYKGDNCKNDKVLALGEKYEIVGVRPEVRAGGHARQPERSWEDRVLRQGRGRISRRNTCAAPKLRLAAAKENGVAFCVLKSRSPSCGKGVVYDGTFTGKLTAGNGVAAALLMKNGFSVLDENEL